MRQVIARNDIRVEVGKIERELAQLERAEKAQTRDTAPPPVPEKMDLNPSARPNRRANIPRIKPRQRQPSPLRNRTRGRRSRGKEPTRATQGAARAVGGVAGGATKIAAKALDGLASAFESFFGGGSAKVAEHRPEPMPTPTREGQAPPARPLHRRRASRSLRHPRRSQRQRGRAMRRG